MGSFGICLAREMLTYAQYAALSRTSSSFKIAPSIRNFQIHQGRLSNRDDLPFFALGGRLFRHLPRPRNSHIRPVCCAFANFEQLQNSSKSRNFQIHQGRLSNRDDLPFYCCYKAVFALLGCFSVFFKKNRVLSILLYTTIASGEGCFSGKRPVATIFIAKCLFSEIKLLPLSRLSK